MAIITISRGSFSRGKEVAEKVASDLGYKCLSREVILDASDRYHIPEIKLIKAIHDAPSILERIGRSKFAYIAYYQSALARAVQEDNVVYHGLAGHLLLKGIPHVLKVRIIADLASRVKIEMERDGIGEQEARALILRNDQERRNWTQSLYGVDTRDSSLYDIVIHINNFKVSDAADIICRAAVLEQFRATREAQQKMDDLALASRIKAALVDISIDVAVLSEYGNVLVYTKADERISRKLEEKFKTLHGEIDEIHNIEFHPGVPIPPNAI